MRTDKIKRVFGKAVVLAVCSVMLFAQTGCMTLIRLGAEVDAEDTVTTFLKKFLTDPEACKYSSYCTEDIEYELTDEQYDMFTELTADVKYEVKNSSVNNSMTKATVFIRFTNVCDVNEFEILSGTEEDLLEEADRVGTDTYDVKFVLKLDKKNNWKIDQMDEFTDLMMDPYTTLNIGDFSYVDPGNGITVPPNIGNDVVSDLVLVQNAYIYTVWFDVEMESPLTTQQIPSEKAYAIMNVFYFSTPINGSFNAILYNGDGKMIMSNDYYANNEVTVECDFSAGYAGIVAFDPGDYYVELYYDDTLIATSEVVKIK